MGFDAKAVIAALKHDDSQGFHPQELQWFALQLGFTFIAFDAEPMFSDGSPGQGCPSMERLLKLYSGVLIGWTKPNRKDHAVAWCHIMQKVVDPNFDVYPIENFEVETFLARA